MSWNSEVIWRKKSLSDRGWWFINDECYLLAFENGKECLAFSSETSLDDLTVLKVDLDLAFVFEREPKQSEKKVRLIRLFFWKWTLSYGQCSKRSIFFLPSLVVPSLATNSWSPTSFSFTLWSFSFRLVSMISSISCSQFTRVGSSTLLSVSSFRLMLIGLLALNEFRSLYCWFGWRVLNWGGWLLFVNEVGNWCEFSVFDRRDEIDLCDWFACSFRPINLLVDSTRPLELGNGEGD